MASQLDRALDEVIKDRRVDRRRPGAPTRQRSQVASGGIRKRDAAPIRPSSRTSQTFVRTVQLRDGPSRERGGGGRRNVNEQWTHDLFDGDRRNSDRSISSRLGPRDHPSHRLQEGAGIKIENLHYNVTENDLQELFQLVGPVEKTRILFDRSGRSTGSAIIKFCSPDDASKAMKKYDNVQLDGQAMHIEMAPEERTSRFGKSGGRQGPRETANRRLDSRGRRRSSRDDGKKERSATQLDEEMDAYMKTSTTGAIAKEDVDMVLD
ncbi:hypothetical protein DFQ28_010640 [Apophysomyces sp. BC1034]|nr:hypothetical protein DFQ30_003589 [Apophysomyces sp. BC1015]KAG0179148.1 hypothetical protein DFQ29_002460 [Apophysomyces sp. BC1021]KAG0184735.1 hypothetical protein DFQ28_010640 [Apophysomyces sp. BC1034]